MISRTFPSKLEKLLATEEVQLEIDNDVAYHVAINALHLRRYRRMTQSAVAKAMHSSQPAIARIEGGDENITLRTLKRLIAALDGRLRLSIEPKEAGLPHWGPWWECIVGGVLLAPRWTPRGVVQNPANVPGRHIAGVFSATPGVFSATAGTLEGGKQDLLLGAAEVSWDRNG